MDFPIAVCPKDWPSPKLAEVEVAVPDEMMGSLTVKLVEEKSVAILFRGSNKIVINNKTRSIFVSAGVIPLSTSYNKTPPLCYEAGFELVLSENYSSVVAPAVWVALPIVTGATSMILFATGS